jgi:hypothetical protein
METLIPCMKIKIIDIHCIPKLNPATQAVPWICDDPLQKYCRQSGLERLFKPLHPPIFSILAIIGMSGVSDLLMLNPNSLCLNIMTIMAAPAKNSLIRVAKAAPFTPMAGIGTDAEDHDRIKYDIQNAHTYEYFHGRSRISARLKHRRRCMRDHHYRIAENQNSEII